MDFFPPPTSPVFKRKKRLLVKSFVVFAVSRAARLFDTHSLAPVAWTLEARGL